MGGSPSDRDVSSPAAAGRWVEKHPLPPETCPQIDSILHDIAPIARRAAKLYREGERAEREDLIEFADDVDTLMRHLPDDFEAVRHANAQLRDGCFYYYEALKEAARTATPEDTQHIEDVPHHKEQSND